MRTALRSTIAAAGSAPGAAVLAVTAGAALLCGVAADSRWLAALGGAIERSHSLPHGLPYATAQSDGWPNVLVGSELVLHGVYSSLGDRGLMGLQVAAVALAWALLAAGMHRRRSAGGAAALALILAGIAAWPALIAARVQLFSLVAFVVLLELLRSERESPSRRIWWAVPLVAAWANLHGAVLVGVAVAAAYLLVDRVRLQPRVALGVLAASVAALGATPQLWRSVDYYAGVLGNEAARRGEGMWAPIHLTSAVGLTFLVAAGALAALALRSRPPAWELAAAVGLAVMALRTERASVWLVLLLAVPAAAGLRAAPPRLLLRAGPVALGMAALVVVALVRGPIATGAGEPLLARTLAAANGRAVLAEPLLAEQVAAAGGTTWVANPLDAFPRRIQATYLDWAAGRAAVPAGLEVVLVTSNGAADRRLAGDAAFRRAGHDARAVLYVPNRKG